MADAGLPPVEKVPDPVAATVTDHRMEVERDLKRALEEANDNSVTEVPVVHVVRASKEYMYPGDFSWDRRVLKVRVGKFWFSATFCLVTVKERDFGDVNILCKHDQQGYIWGTKDGWPETIYEGWDSDGLHDHFGSHESFDNPSDQAAWDALAGVAICFLSSY